jgi:hypothetical protein
VPAAANAKGRKSMMAGGSLPVRSIRQHDRRAHAQRAGRFANAIFWTDLVIAFTNIIHSLLYYLYQIVLNSAFASSC